MYKSRRLHRAASPSASSSSSYSSSVSSSPSSDYCHYRPCSDDDDDDCSSCCSCCHSRYCSNSPPLRRTRDQDTAALSLIRQQVDMYQHQQQQLWNRQGKLEDAFYQLATNNNQRQNNGKSEEWMQLMREQLERELNFLRQEQKDMKKSVDSTKDLMMAQKNVIPYPYPPQSEKPNNELMNRISLLEQQLEERKNLHDKVVEEKDALQSSNKELQRKSNQLLVDIDAIESERNQMNQALERLSNDLTLWQNEVAKKDALLKEQQNRYERQVKQQELEQKNQLSQLQMLAEQERQRREHAEAQVYQQVNKNNKDRLLMEPDDDEDDEDDEADKSKPKWNGETASQRIRAWQQNAVSRHRKMNLSYRDQGDMRMMYRHTRPWEAMPTHLRTFPMKLPSTEPKL